MAGERSRPLLYLRRSVPRQVENYETVAHRFDSAKQPLTTSPSLHQLPPDLRRFVGQQEKQEKAIAALKQATISSQVVVISGRAGIGKSTLAIHVAHQIQPQYPDAQLYINLRGHDAQPLQPAQALAHFLRSWGVSEAAMPVDLEERSQLFQLHLSSRRTVLLLDNAADEAQVQSLIPVGVACAVLITSRKRLIELPELLPNTTLIDLTELSESDALALLQEAEFEEVQSEPDVSMSAVNLCNRLPLAVCTLSCLLRQGQLGLKAAVEQLGQERRRSKQFHLSHSDIRGCFVLSYKQLTPTAAHLLRLLALLTESTFSLALAAVLLKSSPETAGVAIQELMRFCFLKAEAGDRYCFTHDLIRLLARGQLAVEESTEARQTARQQICQWLLGKAKQIDLGLDADIAARTALVLSRHSRLPLPAQTQKVTASALHWFETERLNLLTAVEWAHQAEAWEMLIQFAEVLMAFFELRQYWADWERVDRLALEAARKLNDPLQTASLLNNRGNAYALQQERQKARDCYEQSLALLVNSPTEATAEQRLFHSQTLVNLGILFAQEGHLEKTVSLWSAALTAVSPEEQRQLKKWLQSVDRPLLQQALSYDRDTTPRSRWQRLVRRFGGGSS